ncbi:hypothetical protein [Niveibacterium sp. SC-1]|uniref:hypothetical protein n=1 Tax=Niveibacterium sp. SC-1 TaxID=3135646 RepID=UPI00311ECE2A
MKSKCSKLICFSALAALFVAAAPAQADLVWSWDLKDYKPVVGPSDPVVLNATLVVEASSSEHLTGAQIDLVAAPSDNPDFPYAMALVPAAFFAQFEGLDLAPGSTFDFVFGELNPIGAPLAPGAYFGDLPALGVIDAAGVRRSWTPDQSLVVTVKEAPVGELPEPQSLALAVAGLCGIWGLRRRA